jgi:hypothetical protein
VISMNVVHVAGVDGQSDSAPGDNTFNITRTLIIGAGSTPTPLPTQPPANADSDGDGWTNSAEAHIGTLADARCGDNGWPADLVGTGPSLNTLDTLDMASFITPIKRLGSSPGDQIFDSRWDLAPGATVGSQINVEDMATLTVGPTAYPPMFHGQRAFGKSCPSAP